MPRDISGNYTLPAGNPVVTGTTISSTWANNTLNDIATALTNSLSIDGSVTTAKIANGAVTPLKLAGFSSGNTGVVTVSNDTTTVTTLTPSVNGIQFPATQVPSADPNQLDDYEEGTWTPTFTFATPGTLSVTYAARLGYYTKIGNTVHVWGVVFLSTFTLGSASGNFLITGLPFANTTVTRSSGAVLVQGPTTLTSNSGVSVNLATGASQITLQRSDLGNGTNLATYSVSSNFGTTGSLPGIEFQITYRV